MEDEVGAIEGTYPTGWLMHFHLGGATQQLQLRQSLRLQARISSNEPSISQNDSGRARDKIKQLLNFKRQIRASPYSVPKPNFDLITLTRSLCTHMDKIVI
jgi:hypothetical protein